MLKQLKTLSTIFCISICFSLSSCETEDPGPIQEVEKDFSVVDFDRIEIGSALNIRVEQSNTYSIEVTGDRRNVEDIEVYKSGSTLIVEFDDNSNRQHETYITINMPYLDGANFSGASVSKVVGFESDKDLDLVISGASVCQLSAGYREMNLVLSGSSTLLLYGLGDEINAEISGASVLDGFDYPVREASVNVSGASAGQVTVTDELKAIAAGASTLLYRGNPSVTSTVSGASTVIRD